MNVAGIDFSSHYIDVVLVDVDGRMAPRWHRYPLSGQDAFDRARSVADAMPGRSSVYWDNVLAVGIEEPTGKFKPGIGYRIQGAILAQLPPRMMVEPWPPSKWRKAVGLPGNASKDLVAQKSVLVGSEASTGRSVGAGFRLAAHFLEWPQDAHDAHLIALATRHAITQQEAA